MYLILPFTALSILLKLVKLWPGAENTSPCDAFFVWVFFYQMILL